MRSIAKHTIESQRNPNLQGELINVISSFSSEEDVLALGFEPKGVAIYQRNLLASASRALAISYPTVNLLLGPDVFSSLIRDFIIEYPKVDSDWALWGEHFPSWLKEQMTTQNIDYIVDCARLDWLIHLSYRAKDNDLKVGTLSLLETNELNEIKLKYSSSVSVFYSEFPVVEIYLAHQLNQQQPNLSVAREMLENEQGQTALVYRKDFVTNVRSVMKSEEAWLSSIYCNVSILDVLSDAQKGTLALDIWLPKTIEEQLFSEIQMMQ